MSKMRIVVAALVWTVIIATLAMGYKFFIVPARQKAAEDAKVQEQIKQDQKVSQIINNTSAHSRYDTEINFGIDSFTGYATFRSKHFEEELANLRIRLSLSDDGANYNDRIAALKSGKIQMGVFTVDAFIKASASQNGTPPATIIGIVDETRGADAIVGYKDAIPNLDALNAANVKIVLTPDSPSETLARVVMANFHLTNLDKNPFIKMNDAKAVFEAYRKSPPNTPQVFVLWEPYVSKILDNPNTHVVIDSSRFRGYIVDVIVCSRDFLVKNPTAVKQFMECYFRSLSFYKDQMTSLVIDDGKVTDTPITEKQAKSLINGVWWKNTGENYSHFGIGTNNSLQHIEDIVLNLIKVQVGTGSIASDPTGGKPYLLYYDGILRKMYDENYHPSMTADSIREDKFVLPSLTDKQWDALVPIGTVDVPPLSFARGTSSLTESSTVALTELIAKLKAFPSYYVLVKGNASTEGDIVANAELAKARAKAAGDYLVQQGIDVNRVRAIGGEPSGQSSVTFVFGQMAY